jgi:hypothetical protein
MSKSVDPSGMRYASLRIKAARALANCTGFTNQMYTALEGLLRPGDPHFNIMTDMTDDDVRTLKMLCGPHSYVVYKMLKARA